MSLLLRQSDLRTLLYIATVIKFLAIFEYIFIIFLLIFLLDFIVVTINLIQLLAAILIWINYLSIYLHLIIFLCPVRFNQCCCGTRRGKCRQFPRPLLYEWNFEQRRCCWSVWRKLFCDNLSYGYKTNFSCQDTTTGRYWHDDVLS